MKIGTKSIGLWVAVIFIPLSYLYVDRELALFFHEHQVMKHFFKLMTKLGQSEYYLIPSLLIYLVCRKQNERIAKSALLVFASIVFSGIVTIVLKVSVARYRPDLLFSEGLYGFDWFRLGRQYMSFPSAHSTAVFSAFTSFALLWPKYRIPLFIVAALVAFSRVATTQHFLSDVIAGALVGSLTSLFLYRTMLNNH